MPSTRRQSRRSRTAADEAGADFRRYTRVYECAEGGGAKGLFATRDMSRGVMVARMTRWRYADADLVRRHRTGLPGGDAAITTEAGDVITSVGFSDWKRGVGYQKAPEWYRMNHSDQPSCKAASHPVHGVVWTTRRAVKKGEALTWHYGKRDASWSRADFCSRRRAAR